MRKAPYSENHMHRQQIGASLIVSLILLVVIVLLGISAAQISLLGEKSSRNDRDRQIAFQAAEAALMDAELDIENSPDKSKSRSHIFTKDSSLGFPADGEENCGSGETNIYLGLCRKSVASTAPSWQTVNFADGSNSVPYGRFTGQVFPSGAGAMPAKLPRYIIELMQYNKAAENADQVTYFYRVTAIGFGPKETTQVVLQTFYRKES